MARHNNDEQGWWTTIDGRVYDVGDFSHMHPGGRKIMRSYAGMDASDAYRRVRHDVNPEVDAMLGMYEIGAVRRLDFGAAWGVGISPTGLRLVTLKDAYRAWIGLLSTTVEMENALAQDYEVRLEPVTYDEANGAVAPSPYKVRLALHTHRRFQQEYLATLTGERLDDLWAVTSGLDAEHHSVRWMSSAIAAVERSPEVRTAAGLDAFLGARLAETTRLDGGAKPGTLQWCIAGCAALEREDRRFMAELKLALCTGLEVFERWERDTPAEGSGDLVAAAQSVPAALAAYWKRLAALGPNPSRAPGG